MNIDGLAHVMLVCVIVVAVCSIMLVMDVNADRTDSVIDISEPVESTEITPEETEPTEEIEQIKVTPEVVRALEKTEIKDAITTLKETIRAARKDQEPSEPIVEPTKYFDVPLSTEIQDHIFIVCEEYGIEPEIIIAMIRKESNFKIDILGDNGAAFGLLQVHPRWHQDRMDRLGVTDIMDPCQNIAVAVDYLAECIAMGRGSLDWGLMAYNGGPSYARELWAEGKISYYAQIVQKWAREYAEN